MVLCDGAMVINIIAGAMMNGICCVHQMEQEERRKQEQRESLKKAISVEWQRQRLIEQQRLDRLLQEKGIDEATIIARQRRKHLMTAKMRAQSGASEAGSSHQSKDSDSVYSFQSSVAATAVQGERINNNTNTNTHTCTTIREQNYSPANRQRPTGRTPSTTPVHDNKSYNGIPLVVNSPRTPSDFKDHHSVNSSLFDGCDSDDDDDFEDVLFV